LFSYRQLPDVLMTQNADVIVAPWIGDIVDVS